MSDEGTPKPGRTTAARIIESAKSAGEKAGELAADSARLMADSVRSGTETTIAAAGDLADKVSDLGEQGISAAADVATRSGDAVRAQATQGVDAISRAAERTRNQAEPTVRKIAGSVKEQGEQSVAKLKETAEAVAESAGTASARIQEATSDAAGRVAETAVAVTESVSESVTEAAKWTSATARRIGARGDRVATQFSEAVADAVARSYRLSEPVTRKCAESARNSAKHVEGVTQGVLATEFARSLNDALAELGKGAATIYDKAMDAAFLETGAGGTFHRLFDGGHTIWGAFLAAKDAPGDDGIVERALGMALGLFRDGTTPRGLPFFTWDKVTYDSVAGMLKDNFDIPKLWFYDLLTYDAAEVLGSAVGAMALVFQWTKGDAKVFSRIVGSSGLAAVVGANPLLGVVMVAALAKAFTESRAEGAYENAIKGLAQGSAGTGAAMAGAALVGAAGGPAGLALIVSLGTGIAASHLAGKAGEKVDFEATGAYLAGACKSAVASTSTFARTQFDRAWEGLAPN